jgi:hypothetical protein
MVMGMVEKLEELISQIQYMGGLESRLAEHLIANDVAPVVLCKYCKHYGCERTSHIGRTKQFCKLHKGLVVVNRDTFCSYGERKENG